MYLDEYKRWLAADLEDADLKPELSRIEGNDEEIKDRFAVALKFGTAGLRGVLGAGTNRMNIYVVRQATQGLANWVKTQGGNQTVAISYDSRLKSDVFAKTAAGVLAANGIKVRIYDALMPVPALSFATRYYECNAGIMVTASHNPAKYNGYKAYGPDGCQMTDDAAAIVYDEIQKTDVLTGANLSQGQRQLIAIARAAVTNPEVLILDEATSSIDTRTELLIERGMDSLMEGRTVFVIAHRLSTVRNSNAIMVLEKGRIIERGDHEELLRRKGRYYELYTGMFELS